jgi:outer membrane protein insertion porin family
MRRPVVGILAWAVAGCLFRATLSFAASGTSAPPTVIGVELASPHLLPRALVQVAIGELIGHARSRLAIRQSLDRLWDLGLFSEVWVEEVSEPRGVRLTFHLIRRPSVRSITWRGTPGLSTADLAVASGLALDGDAGPERLEQARRDLLAAYAREGFFAARVEIESTVDRATNARDLTVVLAAGPRAEIGDIRLRGISDPAAESVLRALRLVPGDRYGEKTVHDRIAAAEENFRKDGFLEAHLKLGTPVWDAASNRVPLEIEVHQGPQYRVEFRGAETIGESALRARLTLRDAGVVDEMEVSTSAREMESAYREAGYPLVQVFGALDQEAVPAVIRFDVLEGPRVTVEAVTIEGSQTFPADRLRDLMQTRPPGFLRRGLFRQDLLDRDLLVLKAFYHTQGFHEATVGPAQVQFSEDRQRARITIPIGEGPRLVVGRIIAEGTVAVPAAEILEAIPLKPGDPWADDRVEQVRRQIARLYGRHGYLAPRIEMDATPREDRMDVAIRIQEGIQTRVGRILISGLAQTKEEVVRRELPFQPGDPLDLEKVSLAERRLAKLGIFDGVEVAPLPSPPPAFADVEFRLREGKPWRVDFGGGYSTDERWRGFLEVGRDNLFGTGRGFSLRETVSSDGDRTDASYQEPWMFGTSWHGDLTLFRQEMKELGYFLREAGGSVGAQRQLLEAGAFGKQFAGDPILFDRTRGLHGLLRYRLNWVQRTNVDPGLAEADVVPGTQIVASFTPALNLDLRDSLLDPKRGSWHLLSVELGGPALGSEVSFVKSVLQTAWYLDWLPPTTLVLTGRLGLATPLGNTRALAIEDRFKAGGSTTIRGYPKDKVGPLDANGNPQGGNALVILNAEWRFPIWRWLAGAVFVDTGTVTPTVGDLGGAAFKTGVGGGIRVSTPVGPLRLDIGYALNPIPTEDRWQLYFSFGQPF